MSIGLLENESTGGAIAREGFEYQDAFVLQNLPLWLSQGAFSHVVSEAVGDVEVCYFTEAGVVHVFHEAKNHTLTEGKFWEEMERFLEVYSGYPAEFPHFVLVCRGYNSVTSPLVNMVERLRGVGSAFASDSDVLSADREAVVHWVMGKGRSRDLGEFVVEHVTFITYSSEAADQAFAGELATHLPSVDISSKRTAALRDRFKELIRQSSSGPLRRRSLEEALEFVLDGPTEWRATSTRLRTLDAACGRHDLCLEVGRFVGADRAMRTVAEWAVLVRQAETIAGFIMDSRSRRSIHLDGKQRMSMAAMLGFVFSAAKGFTLEVEHNGVIYRTDNHTRAERQFFKEQVQSGQAGGEGVVCIGFPTPVGKDVGLAAIGSLQAFPLLTLESTGVVSDIATLNAAVAEAKTALVRFRSENALTRLHMFVKAPSAFAIALGHRLNGIAELKLYDWIDGQYLPTATL